MFLLEDSDEYDIYMLGLNNLGFSLVKTETSRGIEEEKGIRGLVSLYNSGKAMVGARENDELRTDVGAMPEAEGTTPSCVTQSLKAGTFAKKIISRNSNLV